MTAQTDYPGNLKILEIGNPLINDEQRRLREFISRLRAICEEFDTRPSCVGCPNEISSICETSLIDCVTELLGFMVEHFRKEENLMKDRGISAQQHDRYLQHAEDHANIAERVAMLALPRARQETVRVIADTASVVSRWLDHHITHYDVPMLH